MHAVNQADITIDYTQQRIAVYIAAGASNIRLHPDSETIKRKSCEN